MYTCIDRNYAARLVFHGRSEIAGGVQIDCECGIRDVIYAKS
jgi:hypothetical protein